jgi:hypothetical protein
MYKILEAIATLIYRTFYTIRIKAMARKYGYRVTGIEWLPDNEEDRHVTRITPTHDGFDHQGDDCPCEPIRTFETHDDKLYTIIKHREMDEQ